MKFLKLVFKICSTPSTFKTLRKYPAVKALLHLGALSLIFASLILLARIAPVSSKVITICDSLSGVFGDLVIDENGVRPSLDPHSPRHLRLTNGLQLDYFPDAVVDLDKLDSGATQYGFVWSPQTISLWGNVSPAKFFILPLIYRTPLTRLSSSPVSKDEIKHFVESQSEKTGDFNLQTTLTFSTLSDVAIVYYCAWIFLANLFRIPALALFYALVSGLIFHFMSLKSTFAKDFKSLFVVAIYAGFPAILVASCVAAFQLPFLDYQTVFLIGFLIYFFIVINKIEKEGEKPRRA